MLQVDLSSCTGCRRCESWCSFFHTGRVSRRLSRIRVLNLYETGIDGPVVCGQCEERHCLACPEDALSVGSDGQVIVSPASCRLCGACEASCPIGAIEVIGDQVYVCDLCGGQPRCVEACTEGALTFRAEAPRPSLARIEGAAKRRNPSERRRVHLMGQAVTLREHWLARHA